MEEDKYLELLDQAYSELPEVLYKKKRFELPQVRGKLIKTRTHITNFSTIAKTLSRNEDHLLKYFLREAGVRGDIRRGDLILYSRFQPAILNKIIQTYYNTYVECPHCKSPDTTLADDSIELTCKACGHQEKLTKL